MASVGLSTTPIPFCLKPPLRRLFEADWKWTRIGSGIPVCRCNVGSGNLEFMTGCRSEYGSVFGCNIRLEGSLVSHVFGPSGANCIPFNVM